MQPQKLIDFFNAYRRFLESLPSIGRNLECYLVIKAVIYETNLYYAPELTSASIQYKRRIQMAYENIIWKAHSKYQIFPTEPYGNRPILPQI